LLTLYNAAFEQGKEKQFSLLLATISKSLIKTNLTEMKNTKISCKLIFAFRILKIAQGKN